MFVLPSRFFFKMPIITVGKESNLWEEICADFAIKRAQAETGAISTSFLHTEKKTVDGNEQLLTAEKQIFDPAKHSPIFCNYSYLHSPVDDITEIQIDTRVSHPACIHYALTPVDDLKRILSSSQSIARPRIPTRRTSPKELPTIEYLETCVYPILLKGIEKLLVEAEQRKCLERKRSAFNALDYLTRYLYFKNPRRIDQTEADKALSEQGEKLEDIPFVREHFQEFPRAPLPMSLVWTKEEAALKIQSYYRGHLVRKQAEIQELRQWQRDWRESNRNIHEVVEDFWRSHASPMPT